MALAPLISCLAFLILLSVESFHALASRVNLGEMLTAEMHEQWMAEHGRVYKDVTEKARRFDIFKSNYELIKSFNAENHKYKLGLNQFADITNEEFLARNGLMSTKPSASNPVKTFKYENVTNVPAKMDWRTKGAVTPIKNQGLCGSCWAFSAVAAIEGITKLSTGKLISLSEQEIVDCDVKGTNQGCNGGYVDGAFNFIIHNKGLASEANYPYASSDGKSEGKCNAKKSKPSAATIKGYEYVPKRSEASLLKAVANQPVNVYINSDGFQFYESGVFSGKCETTSSHTVVVVGYGVTEDGTKYWLVKNSWGTEWGEKGYIRMERDVDNKNGLCGIAKAPLYPIV